MNTHAVLAVAAALVPALVLAQGDYACTDTGPCATDFTQFPISTNSTCVSGKRCTVVIVALPD